MPREELPSKVMSKQSHSTSCWVTVAQFVLQYTPADVPPLVTLESIYQKPVLEATKTSHSAMAGAGKPGRILKDYGYKSENCEVHDWGTQLPELIERITQSIQRGLPVIAQIKTPQIKGAAHAICIVGIDTDKKEILYKDPAFGDELKSETYEAFFTAFFYGTTSYGRDIWMYCSALRFVSLDVAAFVAKVPLPAGLQDLIGSYLEG